ncbi:hypothetical protein DUNSADRAFT_1266 [Dunaliella salina]|uniref:Uncharacterized protein n=1 Tax=Dunaliella salina TaxID=3046 RepID=A0ABQ7GXE2_DUNSA|nr:hypothetical protein DUNSADRAFT_1266 [Dunaliella salina]|eukprot:KAF5839232.1 hypothetical protein DUNSADRAFT_1266 [Dunaliella salina]
MPPARQQQVRNQQLALVDDPHAHLPTLSLGSLLSHYLAKQPPQEKQRLAMLHVSCPGSCIHEVISTLHTQVRQKLLPI